MATICRGRSDRGDVKIRKKKSGGGHLEDPIISFSKVDYEGVQPHQDDLMVISVVAAEYKKLGKTEEELEACQGTLIGFAGEQVEIQGAINLRTTFGANSDVKTVFRKFMIVKT
ncbi:hypothetical protein CR513_01924, partial [Mucuna pruriens]